MRSRTVKVASSASPMRVRSRCTIVSRTECGSTLATTIIASSAPGRGVLGREVLRVDENRVVVAPVHVEVAQLAQRRVRRPDQVESREVRRERRAGLLRAGPVALLVLVLLAVDVLFAAGACDVLEQLVARVHAPVRARRRGQGRANLVGGRSAELKKLGKNVRGIDEKVGPEPGRCLVRDRLEELGELLLRVAPGEVAVRLLVARLGRATASSPGA